MLERLQASARFRAWARAFPLTRPVARERAAALFDLCAGFVYAQTLFACVQLDLFAKLHRPSSAAELARACDVPQAALERLLHAAEALRLVRRRGAAFGLGPLGAAMVGNAGVTAMVTHHTALYGDLADPVALLRGQGPGRLAGLWPYAGAAAPATLERSSVDSYSTLMAASQALVAAEILDAYPWRRHRLLMDVGGGEGAFLAAVGARFPRLGRLLFDLPAVVARATGVEAVGGDMFRDTLPGGADVVTLIRILHDHDDAPVATLLRSVRTALPPGGVLVVAEPMADTRGAARVGAYFDLYLLAMGQGRARTAAQLTALLRQAGFGPVRQHHTRMPMVCSVLSAVNPA